ncbi:hypothetical protein DV702_12935 [Sporosarcina sp. PTS2304]|uniref:hypothetical protein n=1 Tax=Sporosarcina sp. PTS2304 TaxID=2283194 RepID=UPI000E0D6D90|nr:hypothetical protein [Sporosarcina sp. PTS2304]AXI00546.1 hypothetical protein DV702_12935 [Sporosarcina sp. PTS2304]
MTYFKSDWHEEETSFLLEKLGVQTLAQDTEYGSFAYVIGATCKAKQIARTIDEEGTIDVDEVHELMGVFSSSEQGMIRFALQCFNNSIDEIPLGEVMRPLDEENTKVIKQAIDLRY